MHSERNVFAQDLNDFANFKNRLKFMDFRSDIVDPNLKCNLGMPRHGPD